MQRALALLLFGQMQEALLEFLLFLEIKGVDLFELALQLEEKCRFRRKLGRSV
jgi:hypothetical protein